ncbi:hypothetical protein [Streptomyces sp. NPDC048338]|uniref:hypothetical protein n=1 Tax=Streptomyces sp. NPDC048338 TaxID=3365536 RepID=UPI00371D2DD9
MRAIRVASAALLATVALSLVTPPALADEVPVGDVPGSATGDGGPASGGTSTGGTGGALTGDAVTGGAGDGAAAHGTGSDTAGGTGTPGTGTPGLPGTLTGTPGTPTGTPGTATGGVGADDTGTDGTRSDITSFGYSVTPAKIAPGGTVTLKSDGCEVPSVTVTSGIFETVTLDGSGQGTAVIDVEARVDAQYEVTFDCKGERGTAMLTVARDAGGHTGTTTGTGDTGAHRGVRAGFGSGSAGAGGLGTAEVAAGSALIAGALGGGGVLLMRRRRAAGRG